MCSSLSYSDTTSKCFLSTISQINTSCNVTLNEKSNSSRYCKVFSKPIATDVKYSSFKKEDSFPLEDGVSSYGQIHSSCIYKSKLYVSRYMGKTIPYLRFKYGEKIDLIKNLFEPEKNIVFQKQQDL